MDEELVLKTSNTLVVYYGFDSLRFRNIDGVCSSKEEYLLVAQGVGIS